MEKTSTHQENTTVTNTRRDIHQQVTDTIIQQLEAGTIPWHKPWRGSNKNAFTIPKNGTTGNRYNGINILLLWSSAISNDFPVQEWASFKQWQDKKEAVRIGEKGSMIVYYDTLEKEVDGEVRKIPFIKTSVVFNRSQLASYQPPEEVPFVSIVDKIKRVDEFVDNTGAVIHHKENGAYYIPSTDEICMPMLENFIQTPVCTAMEGYYGTLFHELAHWTGSPKRLNRNLSTKFGNEEYAMEELVAELSAAFLCAELDITSKPKTNHASYIASWLKALKENKHCVFTAASEASKAVNYLQALQPKL